MAGHSSDDSMLNARLSVCDETWIEEHSHAVDGDWSTGSLRLHYEGGAQYTGKVNTTVVRLLKQLDGKKTLQECIRASEGLEENAALPSPARYAEIARKLILRGVLAPM